MFQEYENKIQTLVNKIHFAQNTFHKNNGRYFQSLPVGNKQTPEVPALAKKPDHETKTIPNIDYTDTLPFEVSIDEHVNGDLGNGYTIYFKTVSNGQEYIKAVGQGIGSTYDWKLVEQDLII